MSRDLFDGAFSITRPANATAYAAGDVVANTDGDINVVTGLSNEITGGVVILGYRLMVNVNAVPAGMDIFRIHLFNAPPTVIADNTAFALPAADSDKYLGCIETGVPADVGDVLWTRGDNLNFPVLLDADMAVYAVLETRGAFTPASGGVFTVHLYGMRL